MKFDAPSVAIAIAASAVAMPACAKVTEVQRGGKSDLDRQAHAECIVYRDHESAAEYLATQPFSDAELAKGTKLARRTRACARSGNAFSLVNATALRGYVAEAFYRQSVSAPPAPGSFAAISVAESATPMRALITNGYSLAACVLSRDTKAADSLVRAQIASEAEASAIALARPIVAECRKTTGVKSIDIDFLRWTLAESLLRLAGAVPSVQDKPNA